MHPFPSIPILVLCLEYRLKKKRTTYSLVIIINDKVHARRHCLIEILLENTCWACLSVLAAYVFLLNYTLARLVQKLLNCFVYNQNLLDCSRKGFQKNRNFRKHLCLIFPAVRCCKNGLLYFGRIKNIIPHQIILILSL